MFLRVDTNSSLPIHDQLAGQLRNAIADGDLAAGERLPAARELAAALDVNAHTVLRALQALRDEGLLDIRRGRGTTVTGTAPRLASIAALAHQLITEARRRGLTDREIHTLVEAAL